MAGIYSVSQVNSYIRSMFSQDFALSRIAVRGEVSNCKYHTSGHIYFTLKDGASALAAVMFAGNRGGLSFRLREGQQVVVTGAVDVYERDGRYQLYAKKIQADGEGDLFARFVQLRNRLEEMGMFAAEYKQPIPRYAMTVGVVTASTGAAIRDVINIASRRNPYVQLVLCPVLVQGEHAAESIAAGIERMDAWHTDVMIVGRGGGSIEDLWAFNEEIVARAIFHCRTPVISAVGHETDVTIADYVADLRAPTPSAAAELAVFDYRQFEAQRLGYGAALSRAMGRVLERCRYQNSQYALRLRFYDPESRLREQRQRLADLEHSMETAMQRALTKAQHRLALLAGRLDGLSPLKRVSGGFGFVTDQENRGIQTIKTVKVGELVSVRIWDGRFQASVTERTEYGGKQDGTDNRTDL